MKLKAGDKVLDAVKSYAVKAVETLKRNEIQKTIILLSLPAIIQMVLKMMVGVVDKIMVGQLGEAIIAGVGVSEQIIFFLLMLFSTIGAGVGILASQYAGAKETEKLKKAFGTGMLSGVLIAVILNIVFLVYPANLLSHMGASKEIISQGKIYLHIISFSIPSIVLTLIMTGFFRAFNDNKTPMYTSMLAMVINIILGYIFIFHLKLGIKGTAYATLIARNIEMVAMLIVFEMRSGKIGLSLKHAFRFSRQLLVDIFKIGWPISIDTLSWQFASIVTTTFILRLGTVISGVNEVAKLVQGIVLMPVAGIAMVVSALIGQELGRNSYDMASLKAREAVRLGFYIVLVMVVLLIVLSPWVIDIFKFTVEGKEMAQKIIILVAVFQFAQLCNVFYPNILRAGGDTKVIIYISSVGMWLVGVPLAYVLGFWLKWSIYGIILGSSIGEVVKAFLFYRRYAVGNWKKSLV